MPKSSPRGPRPVYILSDGTPLADAIARSGLAPVTVYSRIRRGVSPDDAVRPEFRRRGAPLRLFTSDGRPLADKLGAASVARESVYRRIRSGMSPDDALR